MAKSAREWTAETARIGTPLLARHLPTLRGPAYYLAGVPLLISQMRAVLLAAGVPDTDIGLEVYTGY